MLPIDKTDYYRNKIYDSIRNYIDLNEIEEKDIKEYSHIEFNGLLRYIYMSVPFRTKDPNNHGWHSVFNKSDIDYIDEYMNILSDICIKYNKVISFRYVQSIYGIPIQYCSSPSKNNENEIAYYIYKWIKTDRESSLADRCIDRNSVMCLALGKIEYGWNENQSQGLTVNVIGSFDSPFKLLDKYNKDE